MNRSTPSRPASRPLQVESLERRELMAGNVSVYYHGNDLYIVGDDLRNHVEVRQSRPGVYTVTGQVIGGDFTRINGKTGPCTCTGVANDIKVILKGGADQVDFGTGDQRVISLNRNLQFDMGTGNDSVYVRDVKVGGFLSVNTGTGVDNTAVTRANVSGNLSIGDLTRGNAGDRDSATVNSCTVKGQIGFFFQQGNDSAEIVSSTADSVYADMGDGNDFFKMTFTKPRGFTALGGRGTDTFFVPDTRYNGSGFETVRRG